MEVIHKSSFGLNDTAVYLECQGFAPPGRHLEIGQAASRQRWQRRIQRRTSRKNSPPRNPRTAEAGKGKESDREARNVLRSPR